MAMRNIKEEDILRFIPADADVSFNMVADMIVAKGVCSKPTAEKYLEKFIEEDKLKVWVIPKPKRNMRLVRKIR